jgi:hypothetical protein
MPQFPYKKRNFEAQKEDPVKTLRQNIHIKPKREASEEISLVGTLISDFQSAELGDNKFLLLQSHPLQDFAIAVLAN